MKLKTIAVTYGRKHNMGNYSSANVEITLWADIEEDENEAECAIKLWGMAKNNVKSQLLPLVTDSTAKVENIFMGLPVEIQEGLGGQDAN